MQWTRLAASGRASIKLFWVMWIFPSIIVWEKWFKASKSEEFSQVDSFLQTIFSASVDKFRLNKKSLTTLQKSNENVYASLKQTPNNKLFSFLWSQVAFEWLKGIPSLWSFQRCKRSSGSYFARKQVATRDEHCVTWRQIFSPNFLIFSLKEFLWTTN